MIEDLRGVGGNLIDHPAVSTVFTTPQPVSLLQALEPAALEQFQTDQTGPFSSNLAESGGFGDMLEFAVSEIVVESRALRRSGGQEEVWLAVIVIVKEAGSTSGVRIVHLRLERLGSSLRDS